MIQSDSFFAIIQALGFTVAHSLWQIVLIWLVFRILTWCLHRHNHAIYLLALLAMLVSAVWAAATFAGQYRRLSIEAEVVFFEKSAPSEVASEPDAADAVTVSPVSQSFLTAAQNWLETYSTPVGWVWLCCASLLWLRLLVGWWMAQVLKRQGVSLPGEAFQNLCGDWAKRLKIKRKIALLESSRISGPLTLGFWKPVILFPAGMLAQLSPAQVEVLLLHELAHIRRHDYLVNLIQLALEVCFFYHPLFWLLSREARTRREYCCDDVVLRHTSNRLLYAKTLTDLQLSLVHTQTQLAMNATGKNHFTERILRIAGITPNRSLRSNWLVFLLFPLLVLLLSPWSSAQTTPPNETAPEIPAAKPVIRQNGTPLRQATRPAPVRIKPQENTDVPAPTGVAPSELPAAEPDTLKVKVEPKSVAIEVVKMNLFYIGVDNPLRIAAEGVPASEIKVELIGPGELTGSEGQYNVRVTEPGEVKIRVSRFTGDKREFAFEQQYRVKRIPDPTPKLGGKYTSRSITKQALLEMPGVDAVLENFLLDATCEVMWYELTIAPKNADPVSFSVTGGAFPPRAIELLNSLDNALGGAVFMDDIKVKCPGDRGATRNVGGLAFKIVPAE